MDNEIVVKITQHTEGGLNYDIFVDNDDIELPDQSDDGGICTSGMHADGCSGEDDNDDKPECVAMQAKPYSREDWENAFDMAKDQALNILFPDNRK